MPTCLTPYQPPSSPALTPTSHPPPCLSQYAFCCRLDPASSHSRGHDEAEKTHNGKLSLLNGIANKGFADLHPQAVLIGGGTQPARFANREIRQAHHNQWHHSPLTKEESQGGLTRFHRWHMDISLYKASHKLGESGRPSASKADDRSGKQAQPPLCTALLCLSVPKMDKPMTVVYGDGSGEMMELGAGSTAFIAGSNMYNLLSDEDKALVDNSRVEYPPHPYTCKSARETPALLIGFDADQRCSAVLTGAGAARGNSNGLGVATEGREVPFEDLPPWDEKDVMVYPMVWTCPVTGQRSFQVHPVPVYKMHLKTSPDGPERTLTDLAEIRALLHRLQRPAISPQYVWAPAYSPGDLVIFYNRGKPHCQLRFLPERTACTDCPSVYPVLDPSQLCTTPPVSPAELAEPRSGAQSLTRTNLVLTSS